MKVSIFIRYAILICVAVAVLLCTQDSLFGILTDRETVDPSIVPLGPGGDHGDGVKRDLVLLQMIFRHGHRSPFMIYPTDATNESFWTEGMGMLTKLGRLQHYAMGLHLQNRYKGFITTNPKEVDMVMAESFRCQFGAYCFLAGLYQPSEEHQFTDDLRWQPIISRHSEGLGKEAKDILARRSCPVVDKEAAKLKSSQLAKDVIEKYTDLYNFWSRGALRMVNSWTIAADLGKTLAVERDYNLTIPEWSLKYWNEFSFQAGISYFFNFGTILIQRLRIGRLLGYMLLRMREASSYEFPEKRVVIYSSHGSYIACLLLALGQFNFRGPPHASTVVVELWRDQQRHYTVRWLYFNASNPERAIGPPIVLRPRGCPSDFCPLLLMQKAVRHLVPIDATTECKLPYDANRTVQPSVMIPGLYPSSATLQLPFLPMLISICVFICHRTLNAPII